jgi:hypothetical protein
VLVGKSRGAAATLVLFVFRRIFISIIRIIFLYQIFPLRREHSSKMPSSTFAHSTGKPPLRESDGGQHDTDEGTHHQQDGAEKQDRGAHIGVGGPFTGGD